MGDVEDILIPLIMRISEAKGEEAEMYFDIARSGVETCRDLPTSVQEYALRRLDEGDIGFAGCIITSPTTTLNEKLRMWATCYPLEDENSSQGDLASGNTPSNSHENIETLKETDSSQPLKQTTGMRQRHHY